MGKVTYLNRNDDDPRALGAVTNGRRSNEARRTSSSPEFEFWMVRNPSCPPPVLLSADELFVDGVLLPLHLVSLRQPEEAPSLSSDTPPPVSGAKLAAIGKDEAKSTPSKRWRDLFKKKEGNDKGDKKERKGGSSISGSSSAELNINIWPFSRSRSAGNGGTRRRQVVAAPRKVSSAPCSRSNSAGESKSRKWPSSPGRPGVHVGRSSPVWQVKRGGKASSFGEKAARMEGERAKISSRTATAESGDKAASKGMNVQMCVGYKQNLNCRIVENGRRIGGGVGSGASSVGGGVNIFNLRSFFRSSKRVY